MPNQQHKGHVAPWVCSLGNLCSGLTNIRESMGQGSSCACAVVAIPTAMPLAIPGEGEGSLRGFAGAPIAQRFDREFGSQRVQPAAATFPGRQSLGEQEISLTARADSTFLGTLPDAIARPGPSLCCLGCSTPSPCPFPLWQVHSVHVECGVHTQPVQLSPSAVPWSFRAPGVAVPAPWLLAPVGLCGQQTDTAQIRATIWTKLCF